ncbi:hypothetical protein PYCCODRAFT_1431373 [Trametes coccinea BRFM310]|uniref:C2H2-type domain-containing protein n=1 Tax=Trametes coccinea (strain BRFM310) TaxID=1353009 RepID=A0A1Y2IZ46_TRAC3|nr:hypothetical protein PYCCODRAFT_1431373 [Trametes coccinea BRFM310]
MPTRRRNTDVDVISLGSGSDDDNAGPVAGPSRSAGNRRVTSTPVRRRETRSAELDVPHALDDASRTQLHVAIATAPEERVREAFAALVDALPTVTERVFQTLVAADAQGELQESGPRRRRYSAGGGASMSSPRREREMVATGPRLVACANCGKEYNASTSRQPSECKYHRGRLEVDYAAFVDWDEEVHGEMDTPQNRREFPQNFRWTCCRRDGTRAGCVGGEHEPSEGQSGRKRARRH